MWSVYKNLFPSLVKTQSHPGYDCFVLVDSWDSIDAEQCETERPRVMTYVQKGAGLRTQQRRPIDSHDLLWINVNGYAILNIYRQPLTPEVIDYVTHLTSQSNCLVGDFNVWHDMFEPGVQTAHQGAELAGWSSDSGMDFIGIPGDSMQRAGHVLDLTFSNIPFAQSMVRSDMHSGSDYVTQVTCILGRGKAPLEQFHYRIPKADLPKFAELVRNGIAKLIDPWHIADATQADNYIAVEVFSSSIRITGKPD